MDAVWYAAYGSNLDRERFLNYLRGGRAVGAARMLPGSRDPADPSGDLPLRIPGTVRFGWESPTWGGGIAFYDADATGTVLARAYRLTPEQFVDVAAQEMHLAPGLDLDLAEVLHHGRHTHGPGRCETLHLVGELQQEPVLTFSASSWNDVPINQPTGPYLATMVRGLRESHRLSENDIVSCLLTCAGVGDWEPSAITTLLLADSARPGGAEPAGE